MKMVTCKFAQDEVTHQRLPVGSKKHALSLPEGSVQQGRSHFDARSVCGIREHGKMARTPLACLPKLRRRHGGFFQQTHWGKVGPITFSYV